MAGVRGFGRKRSQEEAAGTHLKVPPSSRIFRESRTRVTHAITSLLAAMCDEEMRRGRAARKRSVELIRVAGRRGLL